MIRTIITLAFLIAYLQSSIAQDKPIVEVPAHVYETPKKLKKDIVALTEYLIEPCSTQKEKGIAIFAWIADNVKYDVKGLVKKNLKPQSAQETISRKKGICHHYAELFNEMCELAEIESYTVCGYAKGLGYRKGEPFVRANHAWNIVNLDGEWINIDMTWGSGFVWYYDVADAKKSEKASKKKKMYSKLKYFKHPDFSYFAFPSSEFVEEHFPWTSEFQLLSDPVDIEEFEKDEGLKISDAKILDYEAKMAENSAMNKKALEYKMGFGSHDFNPRNHFDKAVTIIIENYGFFQDAEIKISKKNSYKNLHTMFVKSEDLLKKHKEVLSEVGKERKAQIKTLEKQGKLIPSLSKKLNPLKGGSLKSVLSPTVSKMKTLDKSRDSNAEKIEKYDDKLEGETRMDHSLKRYPEWITMSYAMEQYNSVLDSLDMITIDIDDLTKELTEEITALNQGLRIKFEEHIIIKKTDYCKTLAEEIKKKRDAAKLMNKRTGIIKKEITSNQSIVRQYLSKENQEIRKELREDKESTVAQRKMTQNISNYIAYYENVEELNVLVMTYYQKQIQNLKSYSDRYNDVSKRVDTYEDRIESHIEFLEEIQKKNSDNEVKLMEEWMKYAQSEKKRIGKYVKQTE